MHQSESWEAPVALVREAAVLPAATVPAAPRLHARSRRCYMAARRWRRS